MLPDAALLCARSLLGVCRANDDPLLKLIDGLQKTSRALYYVPQMKGGRKLECYTIAQAARLSGLKTPMLDYLCRTDTVVPTGGDSRPGRGNPRLYSFGDVVVLRATAKLLSCGITVSRLRRGLRRLREQHSQITRTSLPGKYLVTDGKSVYFVDATGNLENLNANGQFAFAFVLELEGIRDEVASRNKQPRPELAA